MDGMRNGRGERVKWSFSGGENQQLERRDGVEIVDWTVWK